MYYISLCSDICSVLDIRLMSQDLIAVSVIVVYTTAAAAELWGVRVHFISADLFKLKLSVTSHHYFNC